MGIESDQLVYDYLSRVGDLAQQQQLPSGTRMRLVSTLRGEIDRQRREQSADTPAAVRRIIGRLGTPDALVAAAAEPGDGPVEPPPERSGRAVPAARETRRGLLRKDVFGRGAERAASGTRTGTEPEPGAGTGAEVSAAGPQSPDDRRRGRGDREGRESRDGRDGWDGWDGRDGQEREGGDPAEPEAPEDPANHEAPPPMAGRVPSPPHMAGTDELGPSGGEPDWWMVEPGSFGAGVDVPGFTGGVEIPAMMRPPSAGDTVPRPRTATDEHADGADGEEPSDEGADGAAPPPRRRLLGLLRRAPREVEDGAARRGGFSHPLLLVAAALLVAGAVLGSWLALAGGWLLAYSSRTLSRAEAKWAAMGLPGVVVAGGIVWLWGRMEGRWGEPVARDGLGEAMSGTWPVLVRTAAIASAAFLVWRARRRAG
ncbi:hypothetical protein ACFYXM_14195 [Streptomyces sp. NPDC002476]|uniref:hypothetical protein n=1 Tax=Streptomyces sp. NPDC002476 TaxID=3364648 RepID=UPI003679AC32